MPGSAHTCQLWKICQTPKPPYVGREGQYRAMMTVPIDLLVNKGDIGPFTLRSPP